MSFDSSFHFLAAKYLHDFSPYLVVLTLGKDKTYSWHLRLYLNERKLIRFLIARGALCDMLLCIVHVLNRPRSIYQYSNMVPRLSGQNCKFFKFLLSVNSQRTLGYKENNTKYRSLTRKPRSHVRILIYRTWPTPRQNALRMSTNLSFRSVTHFRLRIKIQCK